LLINQSKRNVKSTGRGGTPVILVAVERKLRFGAAFHVQQMILTGREQLHANTN